MGLGTAATLSLVSSGAQAGMSFAQMRKQQKLIDDANTAATEALADAQNKLDVNFQEQTSIAKQAYELEREAGLVASAQATEAGMQSERGAAATAGRVLAATNKAQANVSARMEQDIVDRDKRIAEEESRLRDEKVEIDKAIAEGAQQAIADAQAAKTSAMMSGMEGVISGVGTLYEGSDLYKQDFGMQKAGASGVSFSEQEVTDFNSLGDFTLDETGSLPDFGSMTEKDFKKFKRGLSDEQWAMISNNQSYIDNISGSADSTIQ